MNYIQINCARCQKNIDVVKDRESLLIDRLCSDCVTSDEKEKKLIVNYKDLKEHWLKRN